MEIKAEIEKYKLNKKPRTKVPGSGPSAMFIDEDEGEVNSPRFANSEDEEEADHVMTYTYKPGGPEDINFAGAAAAGEEGENVEAIL
jgi:hypothetical protein